MVVVVGPRHGHHPLAGAAGARGLGRRELWSLAVVGLFYRLLLNPLRALVEARAVRDLDFVYQQKRRAWGQPVTPKVRYINLIVSRDTRARRIA